MLNKLDRSRIEFQMSETFNTLAKHHYVTLSDEDLDEFGNLVNKILSKYENNQHIQGQINE